MDIQKLYLLEVEFSVMQKLYFLETKTSDTQVLRGWEWKVDGSNKTKLNIAAMLKDKLEGTTGKR